MTQQQYTPVSWQDETTSQQGTLINAERLNQMQTAHHFADGLEETDTVPTADPGVAYHKIVYCTADNTLYRWDGEAWTADIDDPTRELLEEHLADHANPHQVTKAQVGLGNCNNTSDADKPISTATQTALDGKLTQRFTTTVGREYVYAYTRTQQTAIEANQGMETLTIPIRDSEGAMHAQVPASPQATHVINYGWANTELDKKADKATTYTKTETDTLLGAKADKATTLAGYGISDAYTKTEADTLLGAKANDNAVVHLAGAETITGAKTYTGAAYFENRFEINNSNPWVHIRNKDYVLGTAPSSNKNEDIRLEDKNGDVMARMIHTQFSDGDGQIRFAVSDITGSYSSQLQINSPANGATFLRGSYRAYDPTHTDDIATIGTLDQYAPMVRTTGNQTISGIKTFTGIVYQGASGPSKDVYTSVEKIDSLSPGAFIEYIGHKDADGFRYASDIYAKTNAAGGTFRRFYAVGKNSTEAEFRLYSEGYMTAPTRAYNASNTSDVATIGTLDAYTPMVRTTGNQTIGGEKTMPLLFASNFGYKLGNITSNGNWVHAFDYAGSADMEIKFEGHEPNNNLGYARAYIGGGGIYDRSWPINRISRYQSAQIKRAYNTQTTKTEVWFFCASNWLVNATVTVNLLYGYVPASFTLVGTEGTEPTNDDGVHSTCINLFT